MRSLRLLALSCVATSCGALQLATTRAPHAVARTRPVVCQVPETVEGGSLTPETLTDEEKEQIEAEKADPLMIAAGGDSDFVRWYRFEKAKEQYLKDNPTDVLANAADKLKGPLSSLVIIGAGFYSIPLIRGLADGFRDGEWGNLFYNLQNPTEAVKF